MAKHSFGKFLLVTSTIAAAAVGAYYYLQSKDETSDDDFGDDDFDDDLEDLDETNSADHKSHNRTYVDLKNEAIKKAGEFKEGLGAAAAKVSDKIVGEKEKYDREGIDAVKKDVTDAVKSTAGKVEKKAEKAGGEIENFFDDEPENNDSKS